MSVSLSRADVERLAEGLLNHLRLEVKTPHWTSPNEKEIVLKFGDRVLTSTTFSVVQKDEYEG